MDSHDAALKVFRADVVDRVADKAGKAAAQHSKMEGGAARSLQVAALTAVRKMARQGNELAEAPFSTQSSSSPHMRRCEQHLPDQVKIGMKPVLRCLAQQCDSVGQQEITSSCVPGPPTQEPEHFQQLLFDQNRIDERFPRANVATEKQTKAYTGALSSFAPDAWSLAVGAQQCSTMPGESAHLSTPKANQCTSTTTPPRAPNPFGPFEDPLFRALRRRSFKDVLSVLESEPDAASLPIFERNAEPPLCCGVRLGCSEQIVQFLLRHGARVDAEDVQGQTPLMLLSSMPSNFSPSFFDFTPEACNSRRQWSLSVAKLLMDAEADSMSSRRNLLSCVDLASRSGNTHLVRLFRGESDVAAQGNEELGMFGESAMWGMVPWTISEPPALRVMSARL